MNSVGDIIRQARGSRGQAWLSERLGIAQTTISQWERNVITPRPDKFPAIESALGLTPGTLAAAHYGSPPPRNWSVDPDAIEGARHLSPEDRQMVADLVARLIVASGVDPLHPPRPEDGRDDV